MQRSWVIPLGTSRVSRPKHGVYTQFPAEYANKTPILTCTLEHPSRKKIFTSKDSHAKSFKTTNSTAKLYLEAMYRGEVLRGVSVIFCCVSTLYEIYKFLHKNQTQILLKYLYTKHNFYHVIMNKKRKEGSLSKHCSRNVLKRQVLIDSIIP